MEIFYALRVTLALVLFCVALWIGAFNWYCAFILWRHRRSKSSQSVPSMSLAGWLALVLAAGIYPSQATPVPSTVAWLAVFPLVDPALLCLVARAVSAFWRRR